MYHFLKIEAWLQVFFLLFFRNNEKSNNAYTPSNYCDLKSPKSPRKLAYSSNISNSNCNDTNAKYDYSYCGADDAPRSPKITYSQSNQDGTVTSGNGAAAGSYYEERSPKYLYEHQSPRKSPKSPRHFVFDAVSPRAEPSGKLIHPKRLILQPTDYCPRGISEHEFSATLFGMVWGTKFRMSNTKFRMSNNKYQISDQAISIKKSECNIDIDVF